MTDTDILIQNLRRENEALKAELGWKQKEIELARRHEMQWISVKDRLPKAENEYGWANCIVTCLESRWPKSTYDIVDAPEEREFVIPAMFDADQKIWHIGMDSNSMAINAMIPIDDAPLNGYCVTHWMPLPEPPKGVNDGSCERWTQEVE